METVQFEEFLRAQALEAVVNQELAKIKYIVENTTNIVCVYTKHESEDEKLYRIVLMKDNDIRDFQKVKNEIKNFHPPASRYEEKPPVDEMWRFVLPHLNDDKFKDLRDPKVCEDGLKNGLIFCYLDQKLRLGE
jgi:hypothetical protein